MTSYQKPKAWNLKPSMTASPELWRRETIVFPMWSGANALIGGRVIAPTTINNFSYRANRLGIGYGQDTDESATPEIKYPSGSFDRSGISDLTFVCWFQSNTASTTDNGEGDALAGNTTANNDGMRAFSPVDIINGGVHRWRLPEAAGNVDIQFNDSLYSARDVVQFVGRLGGGSQDLNIYNWTAGNEDSATSATSSSITFDEGSFWVGQTDDGGGASSFPGDILFAILDIGYRWTDFDIEKNRRDPFAMLRPAGF